jgi:hypothetical protein
LESTPSLEVAAHELQASSRVCTSPPVTPSDKDAPVPSAS